MWTSQNQLYADTIKMVEGCGYYYYVRGLAWTKRPYIHLVAAQAARNLGDPVAEAKHLAFHMQWMARQDNVEEVEAHLSHLSELMNSLQLPADVAFQCRIAIAMYKLNICGDIDRAQQEFQVEVLHHPAVSYRLAFCLYQKGALAEAQRLYREYLEYARCNNRQRNVIATQIHLAEIALLQGNLAQAEEALEESDTMAHRYNIRKHFPDILRLYARLHIMQDNISAAHDCFTEAIDLYERLGMRHDLVAAREELARLQTLASPESDTALK
jgi:tetratricopeptide (TPR) repeat protein